VVVVRIAPNVIHVYAMIVPATELPLEIALIELKGKKIIS